MSIHKLKYFKVVNSNAIEVNPSSYIIKFYCGNIHWINVDTGKEEIIYTYPNSIVTKQNKMEIETSLLIRDKGNDEQDWVDFSFSLKDVIAYYAMTKTTSVIILHTLGEFEVQLPYSKIKRLKEIAYTHETLVHFN